MRRLSSGREPRMMGMPQKTSVSTSRLNTRLPKARQMSRLCTNAVMLFALLILTSCGEETTRPCPVYQVGAVEGYVIAGGEGCATTVGARAFEGPDRGRLVASVQTDSTGWYRLELPTGLYRLETNPRFSGVMSVDARDTITVAQRVHRRDLVRGRVRLLLRLPVDLEGERYDLTLRSSFSGDTQNQYRHVEEGLLTFDFPAVQPAAYVMQLRCRSNDTSLYLPGVEDRDEAEILEVRAEHPTEHMISFEHSFGSISGSVTGSWQLASQSRPYVYAWSADSTLISQTTCGVDGAFTVSMFRAEPVRLEVRIGSSRQWVGGDTFEEAQVFAVQPGDRLTDVSIVECGILLWLEGPGPFSSHRAALCLISSSGQTWEFSSSWRNPIVISNLPADDYLLYVYGHCHRQTWAGQWYDGAESMDEATAIRLEPGELRELNMQLVEGGSIHGCVLDPNGEPPTYVHIQICGADGEPLCERSESFGEGAFSWRGLANGEYYLAARIPGDRETWWYPGTSEFEHASSILISDHEAVTGVDWAVGLTKEVAQ